LGLTGRPYTQPRNESLQRGRKRRSVILKDTAEKKAAKEGIHFSEDRKRERRK
jgi:hypothetical protein